MLEPAAKVYLEGTVAKTNQKLIEELAILM